MSYAVFLVVFLALPILALTALLRGALGQRWWWAATVATILAALVFATPWDNYMVAAGVWSYDPARFSSILLGRVPLEEYLFYMLQTTLTALVTLALLSRRRNA